MRTCLNGKCGLVEAESDGHVLEPSHHEDPERSWPS